jgi:hypothetical protein
MRLWSMGASVSSSIFHKSVQPKTVFIHHDTGTVPSCRTVNLYGTIPGGTSFAIPQGSLSSNNATGTGFNWAVDIVGGTNVLFIGNDDRGIGAGGVAAVTIADTLDSSCLNNNSPSSTAGNPAGGSYPTGPGTAGSGSVGYPTNTGEPSSNGSAGHSSS